MIEIVLRHNRLVEGPLNRAIQVQRRLLTVSDLDKMVPRGPPRALWQRGKATHDIGHAVAERVLDQRRAGAPKFISRGHK
ncbi:hypothetical protein [Sediminicurvatus halobius]|uniref:hypothetical protein n=1 Tax=Sediminicurvatus halobius TaxID=2182432 RepID=UPI0011B27E60|nr:hypothetical protein [Spiribacter halobius]UEX76601.1 hypothetical protein LMH63_11600 [Spiribacter halobius]